MKSKTAQRCIGLVFVLALASFARERGYYWLWVIGVVIALFMLLWAVAGFRSDLAEHKGRKMAWEAVGGKIKLINSMLDVGSFAGLTPDVLRNWLDWVTSHQDIEAAKAFKDILTKVDNAPEGAELSTGLREEARFMLDKLGGVSRP